MKLGLNDVIAHRYHVSRESSRNLCRIAQHCKMIARLRDKSATFASDLHATCKGLACIYNPLLSTTRITQMRDRSQYRADCTVYKYRIEGVFFHTKIFP